jgi:tetratricopeptide (TPR) repeat protein
MARSFRHEVPRRPTPPSRRWVAVSLSVLLLSTAGCGQSPETRKQGALARGEGYLAARQPAEAIIEFQNALQVDSQFVPALHGLGRAYAARYWYLDAFRELARARQLAPDSVAIAVDLGRVLVETGDWAGAEAQAQWILSREPENRDALYLRAAARIGQGNVDEGLRLLETLPGRERFPAAEVARAEALLGLDRAEQADQVVRGALARHPDDARSLAAAGVVSLARQEYAQAEDLYTRARDRDPEDPQIRLGLAAARARQGRLAEAIQELEAVSPRARNGGVVRALARYYLDSRRPGDAIGLLGPLVSRYPRYAQARFLLGLAYLSNHDPERARAEFEALERQLPGEPTVQRYLAGAYLKLDRPGDALARLTPLAKIFEREPEYHLERGRALAALRRLDEAQRAAETALRMAPQTLQAYVLLADIRSQRGDVAGAREMLTRAAAGAGTFVPARLALGRLLLAQRDPQGALREFEAALEAEGQSLPAAQMKALTLVQAKRTGDAIDFVEGAIRSDPRARGFHALLGGLYMIDRQWNRANAAYRKELEVDPQSVDARLGLAGAAVVQGREDEAISRLQEVVRITPGHLPATLLLTSIYSRNGRADLATPLLEEAVRVTPDQTNVSLLLADLYVKSGRSDDAIAIAGRVLQARPALRQAKVVRGQAFMTKGDGAAALREFQEVVRSEPGWAEAHYHLAHAYRALGRTADARAAYREALRLDPKLELARLELATLGGDAVDEATLRAQVDRLRASLKEDPRNALLREALARTLLVAGRTREAYEELKALLDQAPLHLAANLLSARILFQEGREQEAMSRLDIVLRANPEHVEARLLLARHLHGRGLVPEAIRHLEAVVTGDPRLLDVSYELGLAYASVGRLDEAMGIARQLEQSRARDPRAALLRGGVLLERRDFAAALAAFEAALKVDPRLADAHRGAGQAHEGLGQPVRAADAYRRVLALKGDDTIALNNLAWVLAEGLDRPDEALPLAERAVQLAPRSGEMLDTLGRIHYRRGGYAKAAELLREASTRLPQNGVVHYHLGLAYAKLGRRDDAASALRRASRLDPALAEARQVEALIKDLER